MRFVARVLSWLQARCGLEVCRIVARPLGSASKHSADVRFRFLSEVQLLAHCADAELELSERQVRDAFRRGDLCVGAYDADKLVGYQWLAFGATPHVRGVWVQFDRRSRYSYKKFVRPDYRGRRIAEGLSTHADELCRELGRTSTIGFIRLDNDASWRASARLGSRTVGYAGYLPIGDRIIAFRSPGARRCGFRFYKPPATFGRMAFSRRVL